VFGGSCSSVFRPPFTLLTSHRLLLVVSYSRISPEEEDIEREDDGKVEKNLGNAFDNMFLHEIHLHGPVGEIRGRKLRISTWNTYLYMECMHT
jgi:hypothetical protein